jgi:hypothetical protein
MSSVSITRSLLRFLAETDEEEILPKSADAAILASTEVTLKVAQRRLPLGLTNKVRKIWKPYHLLFRVCVNGVPLPSNFRLEGLRQPLVIGRSVGGPREEMADIDLLPFVGKGYTDLDEIPISRKHVSVLTWRRNPDGDVEVAVKCESPFWAVVNDHVMGWGDELWTTLPLDIRISDASVTLV